jgi:hypothetical protein
MRHLPGRIDSIPCIAAFVVSPVRPEIFATDIHLFPPYTKEKVQAVNQWFEY